MPSDPPQDDTLVGVTIELPDGTIGVLRYQTASSGGGGWGPSRFQRQLVVETDGGSRPFTGGFVRIPGSGRQYRLNNRGEVMEGFAVPREETGGAGRIDPYLAAQLEIAINHAAEQEDRETQLMLLDKRDEMDRAAADAGWDREVWMNAVREQFQKEQAALDRENQQRLSAANELGALRRQAASDAQQAKQWLAENVGTRPFASATALQGGLMLGNEPADVLRHSLTQTAFGSPPGANVNPYTAPLPEVQAAVTGLQERPPVVTPPAGASAFGLAGGGAVTITQDALTPTPEGPTGIGIEVGERGKELIEVTDKGFRVIPIATRGAGGLAVTLPSYAPKPTGAPQLPFAPKPIVQPPGNYPITPIVNVPEGEAPGIEVTNPFPTGYVPPEGGSTIESIEEYARNRVFGGIPEAIREGLAAQQESYGTPPVRSTLPNGGLPEDDPNWNPARTSREEYLRFQAAEDARESAVAGGFQQNQGEPLPYILGGPGEAPQVTPAGVIGSDGVLKTWAEMLPKFENPPFEAGPVGDPYNIFGSAQPAYGQPGGPALPPTPPLGTPPVDAGQGTAGGGAAGGEPQTLEQYVGSLFGKINTQEILKIIQLAGAGDGDALAAYLGTLWGRLTVAEIQGVLGRFQAPTGGAPQPPAPPGIPPAPGTPPGQPPAAGAPLVLSSGLALADYMAQLFPAYNELNSTHASVLRQFASLPGIDAKVKTQLELLASHILAVESGQMNADVLRVDLSNLSQAYLAAYQGQTPPIGTPPVGPSPTPPAPEPPGGPGSPELQIRFLNDLVSRWPNVTAQDVQAARDAGLQNVSQILWDFFAAGGPGNEQAKNAAYLKLLEIAPGIRPPQNPYGPQVSPQAMAGAISLLWQHLGLSKPPTTQLGALGSPGFGAGAGPGEPTSAFKALGLAPKLFRNAQTGQVFVTDGTNLHAITSAGAASVGELSYLGFRPGDIVSLTPAQMGQNISDPWLLGQPGNFEKVQAILRPQAGVPYPTLITPQREPVTGLLLPEPRLIASVLPQLPPSVQDLILNAYQAAGIYNPATASAEIDWFTPGGTGSAANVGYGG